MEAINYSALAALQAFVRTFGAEILTKGLLGFETAQHVDHMPMVKGQLVQTKMTKSGSLIRGFDKVFQGYASQTLAPITYTTNEFKSEWLYTPTDIYNSYLGFLTTKGFSAHEFPIQRYFLEQHMAGVAEEMEIAVWEGIRSGVAAADAPIIQKMDGYGKRITDAIAAGNTPVVTGAIDKDNIIEVLQTMYDRIGKAHRKKGVKCFLSVDHEQEFRIARGVTLQYIMDDWTKAMFNTGRMELIFTGGQEKDKIAVTIPSNFTYNYDDINDQNNWFVKQEHYTIEGSTIMKAGTTIKWTGNDELVVNDQW